MRGRNCGRPVQRVSRAEQIDVYGQMAALVRHVSRLPDAIDEAREIRFIQAGHGQREADAKRGVGKLREPYLHYNFSNGIDDWRQKHDRYSTKEAEESLREREEGTVGWRDLIGSDPVGRRRALKRLSMRLPLRPALRFLYMYVLRLGFLDGKPGLVYCRLLASYERMIVTKLKVLERRRATSL